MYIYYNWQRILECSEEMNRIYYQVDSIYSQIEEVITHLRLNQLDSISENLSKDQGILREIIDIGFRCSKSMQLISEIYCIADKTVNLNNNFFDELFNQTERINPMSNNFGNELVIEPWLRKILEEQDNE